MTAPKVSIRGLTKRFGEVQALDPIDLDLGDNEFVSVVGTSGCGKSTLLSIIAGLTDATSGSVTVDGAEVTGPGRDRGVVFQGSTLLPWLTALGNVKFALRDEPITPAEQTEVAMEHLQLVGLDGFENSFPNQLSGGMQQRVNLARSLSYRPSILLMDEPFGALDALTREELTLEVLRIWRDQPKTILFVTHSISEAVLLADQVVVMSPRPGRVQEVIDVALPRPRHFAMESLDEFQRCAQRTRALIFGDAGRRAA